MLSEQELGHTRPPAPAPARRRLLTPRRISQAGELRSSRVESLRALAALAVLQGHVYGSAHAYGSATTGTFGRRILFGGGFGVFLFFALSGYLLFWPFVRRDYGAGDRVDLRRYALNRVLRIMPLYYATIVILLLVQEHGGSGMQWARFMTWTETFSNRTFNTVDGVVWSLIVELHFYLLLPFLAALLRRVCRGSRWGAGLALILLGGASYVVWVLAVDSRQISFLWRYQLPGTFFFFVPGMLLALIRAGWKDTTTSRLPGLLADSNAWILAGVAVWLFVCWRYHLIVVLTAGSFMLLAACVLPLRPGPLIRALEWRPLAVLGIASYSLYLWHLPLIRAITGSFSGSGGYSYPGLAIRAFPLACAIALISYAAIESPFLRLRRRWSPAAPPQSEGTVAQP